MFKNKKVGKGIFRILTGFIVGGAIGSILGLTLAPKSGKESRDYLKEQFLKGKEYFENPPEKKLGFFKRLIKKLLSPKK